MKRISIIIAAVLLTLLLFGCSQSPTEQKYRLIVSEGSYEHFFKDYIQVTMGWKNEAGLPYELNPAKWTLGWFNEVWLSEFTYNLPNAKYVAWTENEIINYFWQEKHFDLEYAEMATEKLLMPKVNENNKIYDYNIVISRGDDDAFLLIKIK